MKWIVLLLIIAGVAGYFTKPAESVMRESADAVLSDPQNVSQGFESVATTLAGDRAYSNYYVAAKYNVTLNGTNYYLQQNWKKGGSCGLK